MADHLPLPEPHPLLSRRISFGPLNRPSGGSRRAHGASLAEQLDIAAVEAEDAGELDTEFILKFKGATRLKPPYRKWKLQLMGEDQRWGYYVLASEEARQRLRQLVDDYASAGEDGSGWQHATSWEDFVRDVTGIELYGPDDRADASLQELTFGQPELLDVRIWPSERDREAARRVSIVKAVVDSAAARAAENRVVVIDPRTSTTMVRVYADRQLLNALLRTAVVEKVKRPPSPRLRVADLTDTAHIPVGEPSGAPIGVVDDGIVTANRFLADAVQHSRSFPAGYVFAPPDMHGSAVSGLAAYGDFEAAILGRAPVSSPHPVVHARVLEPDGRGRTRFAPTPMHYETFEQAVRWLVTEHGVRVIVAAITDEHEFRGPLIDEWTQTVDTLARELNVVIVVPAGNIAKPFGDELACGCHVLHDYPRHFGCDHARLASPAIAALAVTVGSVASDGIPGGMASTPAAAATLTRIAEPRQPSPFTRVGPGPGRTTEGSLKPDFVAAGGNWVYDHTLRRVDDRDPSTSVITTVPPVGQREFGTVTGTSFAAPRVAHALAGIATRYPDASANLIRALAALAARRPDAINGTHDKPLHLGGFGLISHQRATESGGSRVVLTFDGVISCDTVMIHRMPMPRPFLRGASKRTIRVAIAYDPPVRRQRREYIAGSMSFDVVRGHSLSDVQSRYQRQPSRHQAEQEGLERRGYPEGRLALDPLDKWFHSGTLICRSFTHATDWDEDTTDYFVVVEHQRSPWTEAQRRAYPEQRYALAVELHDEGRADLDLYGLVRAQLRTELRVRQRV